MISDLITVLNQDWSTLALPWAFALAFGIMTFVGIALNQKAKDEIALWLMGGYLSEWPKAFLQAFDTVLFGGTSATGVRKAVQSFVVSALLSIGFVLLVWNVMGGEDLLGPRTDETMSWQTLLITAVAVNVVFDYLSILETRWLLGRLTRLPLWSHLPVLLVDLFVTGALIWGALWLWQQYGWHTGEPAVLGEVAGGFSVLSVFFYSTFLTSLWAWLYVLSAGIMRGSMALKMHRWSSITERPGLWLGVIVLLLSFAIAQPVSWAFATDENRTVSVTDEALCKLIPEVFCPHLAKPTTDDIRQVQYIFRSCGEELTHSCFSNKLAIIDKQPAQFVGTLSKMCTQEFKNACTRLGYLYNEGVGVAQDYDRARDLFQQSCDGGNAPGCTHLGILYQEGFGGAQDYDRARALYQQGCDGGSAGGCTNLGYLYSAGLGVAQDYGRAGALYQQGCDGGNVLGCTNLGYLYGEGLGVAQDYDQARALYQQSCDGGDARGCNNLGVLYKEGLGVAQDFGLAHALYQQVCDGGKAIGCTNLGYLYDEGIGVAQDDDRARGLYQRACELGYEDACRWATNTSQQ